MPWRTKVLTMLPWVLLVGVGSFVLTVWPTPWRDRTVTMTAGSFTARQHRVSGEVQVLCVDGWRKLVPDPFSDIVYPPQTPAQKADPCLSAPTAKPAIIGRR